MNKEGDRNQRKALGKGLNALLPSRPGPISAPRPEADSEPPPLPGQPSFPDRFEDFRSIPLAQIRPSQEQPRTSFDEEKIAELAQSIQTNGLLQPVTVYQEAPDRYVLIAGERRWRACVQLGLTDIAALVRSARQQERLELALIENIQREDLNAIEVAKAFHNLATQHGLSHEQIAERTGKERSTVTNFLRLLKLSPPLQDALIAGHITMGHARTLLNLTEAEQVAFFRRIQNEQLSVRDTERLIREHLTPSAAATPSGRKSKNDSGSEDAARGNATLLAIDPNLRSALDNLSQILGTKVRLCPKTPDSGKLEIEYYSQDDLSRIYEMIAKS